MVKYITELHGNTGRFARHCLQKYTLVELVDYAKDGIDHTACEQWDISGEEWQDAIFSALEELRGSNRQP